MTLATPAGEADARAAGYSFVGAIGHVWPVEPWHYTRALKQYWHPGREDDMLVGSVQAELDAVAAGYRFVRVEGWAGHAPQFVPGRLNVVEDPDYSAPVLNLPLGVEPISWGLLRAGDTLLDTDGVTRGEYRDIIQLIEEPIEPDAIEFVLELTPRSNWWKEIALLRRDGSVVEARGVEGDSGTGVMRFAAKVVAPLTKRPPSALGATRFFAGDRPGPGCFHMPISRLRTRKAS